MDPTDPAYRGQRDYKGPLLKLYDPLVLGPIAQFVWRCPSTGLLAPYRRHIRDTHLDVGPGTGYFLDSCAFAATKPSITLLDLNPAIGVVDLTGSAPEMNPGFRRPVVDARRRDLRVTDRCNLTILLEPGYADLPELFAGCDWKAREP